MPLTLVTGRPNAGKSGFLYERILAAADAGSDSVLVLPSVPDAHRAAHEFALREVAGVRTAVLDQWIAGLWALHGDGTRIVTSAVRTVLVREACAGEPFRALASSAATPGFVDMVAQVAENLADPMRVQPRSPEERELAAALERYFALLEREGLVELSRAALLLSESALPLTGTVALNRFSSFSPAQEAFVLGLAATADVLVSLPWEEGHPATDGLTPLVRRMAERGAHEHVRADEPAGELQLLEERLFCGTSEPPIEPTGAVTLAEAASIEVESAHAVDLALRAIDEGVDADRIVIAFRDPRSRTSLVSVAARRAGVEIDVDVAVPMPQPPMGSALMALLDAVSGFDASRERLAAYLHTPYSGLPSTELERLDARWRRRRTPAERVLAEAASASGNRAISLARSACRGPLTAERVKIWKSLLDVMILSSRRDPDPERDAWDAAVHREALRTLSSLADCVGRGVGLTDVLAALRRTRVTRGGSERPGAVLLTEAHRVASRRFDIVIVGGLTANEFSPEAARSVRRRLLERLGVEPHIDEQGAERLLFYSVATRPRKRLHLLRQTNDGAGQPVAASTFWNDVGDLYRAAADPSAQGEPPDVPCTVVGLPAALRNGIADRQGCRAERVAQIAFGGERCARRGTVRSAAVTQALADREEFGVRELETYSRCPYLWFFEHELRPRVLDGAFEPRHAGTLAHVALARFYERWSSAETPRRVTPEGLSEALDVVAGVLDEVLAEWPSPEDLAEQLVVDRVRRWVMDAVRDDALLLPAYTPLAHEFAFGRAEGRPFEFGGVLLRGRVDRVDVCEEGAVVTDYKSSAQVHGHASFATNHTIQLPAYLAAVTHHLGVSGDGAVFRSLGKRVARGFWRADRVSFDACGAKADAVTAQAVEEILADAAERVAMAAAGIRAGEISPRREACAQALRCPARSACEASA